MGTHASDTIVKPKTLGPGATSTERKTYLDYQLDSIMHKNVLIVLRFLSGPAYRLYGGENPVGHVPCACVAGQVGKDDFRPYPMVELCMVNRLQKFFRMCSFLY